MTATQVHQHTASPESSGALMRAVLAISGELDLHNVLIRVIEAATEMTGARYGALGVVGGDGQLSEFVTSGLDPVTEAGMPAGRHPESSFLEVPITIRGTVFGNLYLTDKRAGAFSETDEELVLALARAAALVIDNARTYGLSERRRQWLEASAELTDALQPPVQLEEALHQIAARARVAAQSPLCVIVQHPDDGHPVISAADGAAFDELAPLVRRIIAEVRVADTQAVAIDVDLGDGNARVVPLRAHLADPGALIVLLDRDAGHEHEEREMLAAFVDQAGLALDRTQAVADRQELAVVSERARIARDLHDVVIQQLFAAGLKMQVLRRGPDAPSERIEAAVDDLVADLDATIKSIRTTIFGLQQRTRASLRTDVVDLVEEYAAVLGFRPELRARGPLDLMIAPPIAEHLLAVLREALSNVARHADATAATVDLWVSDQTVTLEVIDSGVGIGEHRVESGLRNARERALCLDGSLEVIPNVAGGTTLRWSCPLQLADVPAGA